MTRPRRASVLARVLLAALLAGSAGCVRVYHPLSGHRALVVDPLARNLDGVRVTLACIPGGDGHGGGDAALLCDRVTTLFENQGATVRSREALADPASGLPSDTPAPDGPPPDEPTDLSVEIRARREHTSGRPLTWVITYFTFTLLPGITEHTFVQDVVVRDATGFLLASESFSGRIVTRFGAGTWVGNKLLDALVREKDERLTDERFKQALSEDLYRHLSQIVFNARMQWEVLDGEAADAPEPSP